MLLFPFEAPPGYRWVLTKEYTDTVTNMTVRASDYNRPSFCLLVAIGSTIH